MVLTFVEKSVVLSSVLIHQQRQATRQNFSLRLIFNVWPSCAFNCILPILLFLFSNGGNNTSRQFNAISLPSAVFRFGVNNAYSRLF